MAASIKPDTWSTSGTTATLKGIITAGYTLSEDEKSITYNKTKKTGQTIATVKGIKSGAKINNEDVVAGEGENAGKNIIQLGADQVATSDIKVTGDNYKLDLAESAITAGLSAVKEDPEWVKAKGATKATYTQVTYTGFSLEDAGKTLKYYKNPSSKFNSSFS